MGKFNENDYIVVTWDKSNNTREIKTNHCFKVNVNHRTLSVGRDLNGSSTACVDTLTFNQKDKWRYATENEINVYDLLDRPYNTITMQSVVS